MPKGLFSDGPEPPDYRPMADAQRRAAELQAQTARENLAAWKGFSKEVKADYRPWTDAGLKYLAEVQEGIDSGRWDLEWDGFQTDVPEFGGFRTELPGEFEFKTRLPEWVPENFDFRKDPGYQFRMDEGLKAVRRGASAVGGRGSGATLKALQTYGQNMASSEYDKAYNRALQSFQMNRRNAELERQGELQAYGANFNRALSGRQGELQAYGADVNRASMMRQGEVMGHNLNRQNLVDDYLRHAGMVNMGHNALNDMTRNVAAGLGQQTQQSTRATDAMAAGMVGAENARISGQLAAYQAHQQQMSDFWNTLGTAAGAGIGLYAAARPAGMNY